jgi:dynein heavy chain
MHALQVSLHLSHPDVVLQPNVADMKKGIARLALALVESGRQFVRWMDGTCLEAAPIPGARLPAPTRPLMSADAMD